MEPSRQPPCGRTEAYKHNIDKALVAEGRHRGAVRRLEKTRSLPQPGWSTGSRISRELGSTICVTRRLAMLKSAPRTPAEAVR